MPHPDLRRWTTYPASAGLLLFAQRVEECLFDYTLDSYKAPALNTHSRCRELKSAIQDVRTNGLSKYSLTPMLEELASSIRNDPAAQQLLGVHSSHYGDASVWKELSINELEVYAEQVSSQLRGRYGAELLRQLKELIPSGHKKDLILTLTTNLVIEWANGGFSRDYIYFRTKGFFFARKGRPITALDQLDAFANLFSGKPRKWSVTLRGGPEFRHLIGVFPAQFMEIADSRPDTEGMPKRKAEFYTTEHNGTYITVLDVEAVDARTARNRAEDRLEVFTNFVRFHIHRQSFTWIGDALVECEDLMPKVLGPSAQPIHKNPDCSLLEMPKRVARSIIALGTSMPRESIVRLTTVLNMHATALATDTIEAQMFSLWTALESLLPLAEAESRIGRITELAVPILSRSYPKKLLHDLHGQLLTCVGKVYRDVLSQLAYETDLEKCAAIIAVEQNEPHRDQLYAAADRNPLLRHRIYSLKKQLATAEAIHSLLNEHSQRVAWHLHRIYRSRNLLVHSGRTLPYSEALVENLHAYVDRALALLEEVLGRNPRPRNLDGALLTIRLDHQAHLAYLQKNRRNACTVDNVQELVFGPLR